MEKKKDETNIISNRIMNRKYFIFILIAINISTILHLLSA